MFSIPFSIPHCRMAPPPILGLTGDQVVNSPVLPTYLPNCTVHSWMGFLGKRIAEKGIFISTYQPFSSELTLLSQTTSQERSLPGTKGDCNLSVCTPAAETWKRKANV